MDLSAIFFDDWNTIYRTIIAALVAYAGLVLFLRISGKRTLAKLNAFDLVVTVALGSTLATILLSADVALAEGLVAFAMLVALQWIVARLSLAWTPIKKATRSEPRMLLEDGMFIEKAMGDERVTHAELEQAARTQGFGDLSDIAAIVLETDGSFSVISKEKAGSRSALRSLAKQNPTGKADR
jgi:uncharacterized membrane protein YcaP (DUF421 family)